MTEAQTAAVRQISQILQEHFDGGVFAVRARDEMGADQFSYGHHGAITDCIGLGGLVHGKMDDALRDYLDEREHEIT